MCATWLKRLWVVPVADPMTNLNKPTTQWDQCGVHDIRNGNENIPYASGKAQFANALDFLDWYGVPLMTGFGMIIIDDTKAESLYAQVVGSARTIECFNGGKSLGTAIIGFVGIAISLY